MLDKDTLEGYRLAGIEPPSGANPPSEGLDELTRQGYELAGIKPPSMEEDIAEGYALAGINPETDMTQPAPPTFDWGQIALESFTSTPKLAQDISKALEPANLGGLIGSSTPSLQAIIKTAGQAAEAADREEGAVATPVLRMMRGEIPYDPMKLGVGGVAGAYSLDPEDSEYVEGYAKLGDIFRKMGWSEPFAATAGLASSFLLPSNLILGGIAGRAKLSKYFVKPSKEVVRKELLKKFHQGKADLDMIKSKIKPILEEHLSPTAYDEAKYALGRETDKIGAKSIATDMLEDAFKREEYLKVRKELQPTMMDKMRRLVYDPLPQGHKFDAMDGYKNYEGPMFKQHQKLATASVNGSTAGMDVPTQVSQELLEAGIKKAPSEEGQVRIMVNALLKQGKKGRYYAHKLMKQEGLTDAPRLTQDERVFSEIIVKRMNDPEHLDKLSKTYKGLTGKDMAVVENYMFPIKYKNVAERSIEDIISTPFVKHPKPSPSGMFKARQGSKEIIRTDLMNILNETWAAQEWFKSTVPEIIKTKQWLRAPEFLEAAGKNSTAYADEFMESINAGLARGRLSGDNMWGEIMRTARGNITNATMAYKLSTAAVQMDAALDGFAFASQTWGPMQARRIMAETMKTWLKPGYAKGILKKSPALRGRAGGIAGEEAGKLVSKDIASGKAADQLMAIGFPRKIAKSMATAHAKVTEVGYAGIKFADIRTAAGTDEAIKKILVDSTKKKYAKLLKAGKRGVRKQYKAELKQVQNQADYFTAMINGSSDPFIRPMILNRGEGARTIFTFQGFHLARAGTLFHTLVAGGLVKGGMKQKMTALFNLGLLNSGMVAADQAQKRIWELTTGRDIPEHQSFAEEVMWATPTQVPFFGQMLEGALSKRDTSPPLIRQIENLYKGTTQAFKPPANGETYTQKEIRELSRDRGAMKLLESLASLSGALPGAGQWFDLLERFFPDRVPKKKVALSKRQKLKRRLKRRPKRRGR